MGGGQAGAPVDEDHVPWSRPPPPGMATVTSLVTARAGPGGLAQISELERAEGRICLKGQQEGAGAKQPEAEEGLRKICEGATTLRCSRLRLKLNLC